MENKRWVNCGNDFYNTKLNLVCEELENGFEVFARGWADDMSLIADFLRLINKMNGIICIVYQT